MLQVNPLNPLPQVQLKEVKWLLQIPSCMHGLDKHGLGVIVLILVVEIIETNS
jgi:hypothetical protein